jgi:hypothetical protein
MSDRSPSPRPLPVRPNLEYLRKLAKDRLQERRRGGEASARLADAQLEVAREHGLITLTMEELS